MFSIIFILFLIICSISISGPSKNVQHHLHTVLNNFKLSTNILDTVVDISPVTLNSHQFLNQFFHFSDVFIIYRTF